ncbi:hypothetical protein ACSBR2_040571 [Camellia fascicularis]
MEEEPSKPSRSKQSTTTNISKLEACLVPVFQIGDSCSVEMPNERMSVKDVIKELHKIRNTPLPSPFLDFLKDSRVRGDKYEEEKEKEVAATAVTTGGGARRGRVTMAELGMAEGCC